MSKLIKNIHKIFEYIKSDSIKVKKNKSDRTYLIHEYTGHAVGIANKIHTLLGWLDYAQKHDLTLVVYMYDKDLFDGKRNSWECYFKQPIDDEPCDLQRLDFIKNCCSFAYTKQGTRFHYKYNPSWHRIMKILPPTINFPTARDYKLNPTLHEKYRDLYKKYIKLQPEILDYINEEYVNILANKGKILGVIVRGTDYVQQEPHGHPRQPKVESIINLAEQLRESHHWDYIYLATEEKKIDDLFREKFPNKILINRRNYYDGDYTHKYLCDVKLSRENDQYYRDLEYFSSLNLLSRCNMFIGSLCGGSQSVLLMKEGEFEYLNMFDLGDYK